MQRYWKFLENVIETENQTKVQDICLHFEKIRHPRRTQYHACNDRLDLMSNHSAADNWMRTGFKG